MTITLSHEKRRGQRIVSAKLHYINTARIHRQILTPMLNPAETIRGGCLLRFPTIPDNPPEPGTYVIQATLADGFTVYGKLEF